MVVGATAVAAVGTATWLGAGAGALLESSRCNGTDCDSESGARRVNDLRAISAVGFLTAVAGAATTTALLVTAPKSKRAARAWLLLDPTGLRLGFVSP
jgi:hypothetical protein